ncbi:hydroxymethylglutaryl-CoA lyase [Fulvivirgaceae bacterium BMA12]|uniref:Hydroxymethylglutaryl-CoA lyase n=1 Tax=Agaribacillus aureus TaxID=3051825 RepID=A0ABT8LA77_9BACT|nr:hydroxymethylglutaryl-CoA lyase [Fulvivirgaceae bacterium BMA12]
MKLIECPRDAMQGLPVFIPTEVKARYINLLLKVGFDTIDFGSFVSPKAIPQLRDTTKVLEQLDLSSTGTKLLAIVANLRGATEAVQFDQISYLGYPLSLSETFQQRNTNRSIDTALKDLAEIQNLCRSYDKTLVTYLSMGFGNPYGDPYDAAYIREFVEKLDEMGVSIISLADTIGVSDPQNIDDVFRNIIPAFPHIEFGAHLHSRPEAINLKVKAAWEAGCRRFDGAIKGFGGCPMAKDELVGNMATEEMLSFFDAVNVDAGLSKTAFDQALQMAPSVFG